ncbi:MAG: hypothetical protein ISS70_27195 [Phycisphaerae bacterium]|nr:hypothetical protein [Phycisphaerae bacterium]
MDPDRRQLFLNDSKVVNYLGEIGDSELAELAIGDFPAVESLAFAVIEMHRWAKDEYRNQFNKPCRQNYSPVLSGLRRRR